MRCRIARAGDRVEHKASPSTASAIVRISVTHAVDLGTRGSAAAHRQRAVDPTRGPRRIPENPGKPGALVRWGPAGASDYSEGFWWGAPLRVPGFEAVRPQRSRRRSFSRRSVGNAREPLPRVVRHVGRLAHLTQRARRCGAQQRCRRRAKHKIHSCAGWQPRERGGASAVARGQRVGDVPAAVV